MSRRKVRVEVQAGGLKLDVGGDFYIDDGDHLLIDLGDSLPSFLDINGRPVLVNVNGDWRLIGRTVVTADDLRESRP